MVEKSNKNYNDSLISKLANDFIAKNKIVSSNEYMDWLVNFTDSIENFTWSDDDFIYNDIDEKDKENTQLLSYFLSFVSAKKDVQQIIFNESDFTEKDSYYEETLIFKLRGNFYKLNLAVGQGAFTTINKIDFIPKTYVRLDEEFSNSEEYNKTLEECVIINKDLNLEGDELLNFIANLSMDVMQSLRDTEEFKYWDGQRRFLYISTKDIEKIYNEKYFVLRKGQVVAVMSLGIRRKEDIESILN